MKMEELDFFENTSIKLIENEVYASRKQIMELYQVAGSTLSDTIKKLKEDGLISDQIIDNQYNTCSRNSFKTKKIEYFNIDSIISIGFRLRSDTALRFQKWAREVIKNQLIEAQKEVRHAQLMESIAWNHLDAKEN